MSSEGSSFEAVRTTEGVGEGRTYLLESITAEDETSITKDERCYKPSKVIVFKATESDEEIAGEGDASIDKEDANGARHIDYETLETQLDVSGNHQNRIMNLSDIEPSDGIEKTHEFESPTLVSEPALYPFRASYILMCNISLLVLPQITKSIRLRACFLLNHSCV